VVPTVFHLLRPPVPDLKNFGRLPPLAADADVQYLQTQEQAAASATQVGNLVTIPNAGEQLRNGVPRFGNPKDFSAVMNGSDQAMQYGIGVAIQAAYGKTHLRPFHCQLSWFFNLLLFWCCPSHFECQVLFSSSSPCCRAFAFVSAAAASAVAVIVIPMKRDTPTGNVGVCWASCHSLSPSLCTLEMYSSQCVVFFF
jgi:hypothetical protein